MRCCERCGVEEGSDEYPFELECYNGEMLCEECCEEEQEEEEENG